MNQKVIDILTVIAESWRESKTFDEIMRILKEEKTVDENNVNVAFSLFFEKVLSRKETETPEASGLRIFSEDEKQIIGKENYNYLLKLLHLNIITVLELELIIERIMDFPEDTVDKEDINWMTLFALTELPNNVLPGSRMDLFSSDKIN